MGRAGLVVVAGIALAVSLVAVPAQAAAPVARAATAVATPTTTPLPFPFLRAGYVQAPITAAQRIGALTRPSAKGDAAPKDALGARMVKINGRLYYHPVVLADWGTQNLESYRLTGDAFYLTRAEAQANRLDPDAHGPRLRLVLPLPVRLRAARPAHAGAARTLVQRDVAGHGPRPVHAARAGHG